eukprot:3545924-Prymnesium_polylepis.1
MLDAAENIFPEGLELTLVDGSSFELRPAAQEAHDDAESTGPVAGSGEYVCWESQTSAWCATSPTLEPIRIEMSQWLIDFYHLGAPAAAAHAAHAAHAARCTPRAHT